MHCSRAEDGVEAFVELGTLIVEGRLPAEGTPRGYNEGPHCHSSTTAPNPHQCDPSDFLCMRAERLRKHMSLLCSNAVPMCVEVLLCPSCQCGTERARNPEVANIPSSPDFLLEQWTVSVVHISGEPCSMSVRGLFQAVRSQLHFSQLSAWWSCNKGSRPSNVCYRITMPGEAFASQFSRPPLQHSFPPAAVGPNTQLKVSVRTLPRCDSLPVVKCATCTPEANVRKRSIGLEQPLLGESLLDPPGPASSRAHAGLCKWHTGSPPSPPRRRASRQLMARRCDTHQPTSIARHILPVQVPHPIPLPGPVDDRMQMDCNQHGKHACLCEDDAGSDPDELRSQRQRQSEAQTNKINLDLSKKEMEEVLTVIRVHDGAVDHPGTIVAEADKADILLSAILRTSKAPSFKRKHPSSPSSTSTTSSLDAKSNQVKKHPSPIKLLPPDKGKHHKNDPSSPFDNPKTPDKTLETESDLCKCDNANSSQTNNIKSNNHCSDEGPTRSKQRTSDILSIVDRFRTKECDEEPYTTKSQDVNEYFVEEFNNLDLNKRAEPGGSVVRDVPTALDKAKFRRSLDSAASMVFHWRTGLPLTSSPAPLRRASQRFDFDSTITSVSAIRSALFDADGGEDAESESSGKSPCSPQIDIHMKGEPWTVHYQSPGSALLGSFEESVLNGRLEPVSTVHGFTADLGASGTFCPPHLVLPVTVFFYTLGDNDKVSSPYLAHINLSKKGYVVPRVGTIQVTLLNPLGTVIKMFVVMYDLSDMPNSSHTFLRQRTLYMPAGTEEPLDNTQKYLRYLIHLRFATSKSGRLLLHTDIRMIIFRKSDLDTATGHGVDLAYELRSFTYGPSNPKFSPRK